MKSKIMKTYSESVPSVEDFEKLFKIYYDEVNDKVNKFKEGILDKV
jgi:hypothetical protein